MAGGGGGGGGRNRRKSRNSVSVASVGGAGGGGAGGAADPCDLVIDVDLDALQLAELHACRNADVLDVALQPSGRVRAAVCVRRGGGVVGSLSGFQGLTRLLNCLDEGVSYEVTITALSRTACHVRGGRVGAP